MVAKRRTKRTSIIGYCIGALLAVIYAALHHIYWMDAIDKHGSPLRQDRYLTNVPSRNQILLARLAAALPAPKSRSSLEGHSGTAGRPK
jgi:hypothetical protein